MKEIEILKQEKNQLLNEIQLTQDDNHSDVSESVKDQHNELMKTLHNKNKQISDLLHDIEVSRISRRTLLLLIIKEKCVNNVFI